MDTETNDTPTAASADQTGSAQADEPQSYTAICPKCDATFDKPNRNSAESALRLHTQRVHDRKFKALRNLHYNKAVERGAFSKADLPLKERIRLGKVKMGRHTEEERIAMVKGWLASGMSTRTYIKANRLDINPWSLVDWRKRYNVGPSRTRKLVGKQRRNQIPASNGLAPEWPAPAPERQPTQQIEQISMPNYCPECGFNLRTFLMAFTVAKHK
jgi:hypothetical protein